MTALEALFLVLAALQVIAAAGWWLAAAGLGLSRSAGLHWGASAGFLLLSLVLALVMTNTQWLPSAVNLALVNTCILLAFMAMRRGAAIFLRQPRHDLEQALLLAAMLAVGVGHLAFGLDTSVRGGLTSLLLAWVSGWLGLSSGAKLRAEFGAAAALLVSVPMFAVALLFGLRALRLLLGWVQAGGELITAPTDANVWLMIALFVLSVLLNLSLGSMVVLRLVRRLHHVSRHDALTGLLNRRAMQELMEAEHLRLLRGGAGFALLLIDVDHFKRVNDRFGHAVGDAALRAVARCLQAAVRRIRRAGALRRRGVLRAPAHDRRGRRARTGAAPERRRARHAAGRGHGAAAGDRQHRHRRDAQRRGPA
jgi:predicted signal transduction protein with EAL and GGDEF domain